ncbi:putative isoflavone reductase family protein [Diplodia seriata]|uniref:Putative isoflavone reductase family protein n=1 Tax=Diplodia seriata TaxID=420778 RepID=A0A0G2DUQ8_9PEZI|nr:putative isoflavone reductase family protein [Diplodia seriata]
MPSPHPPPPPPPKSILLLGAGELGTAILTSLATHPALSTGPTQFTIALRPTSLSNTTRLASLRNLAPGAAIAFAGLDLASATAERELTALILRADGGAAGPHDVVIGCTGYAGSGGGTATSGTQALIARAVLAAAAADKSDDEKKKKIHFFPWQFGADYDVTGPEAAGGLMAEQCGVRALLREAKTTTTGGGGGGMVDWTIVSTGMFMSFVFEEWFGVVEGLGPALRAGGPEPLSDRAGGGGGVVVRALGGWDTRVTLTDVRDIGRVVAELVVAPPQGEGRGEDGGSVVFAAGETVTYGELADVVQKVVGRRAKVRREEWSLEHLRAELEKDPKDQTKRYRVFFGEGNGVSWDKEKTINAERNIESTGVEQWLREKLSM